VTAFGIFALKYGPDQSDVNGWLESFDPEANDGRGFVQFRPDPASAMRFDTAADALAYLATSPASRPLRADGQPNRPLRAFAIEIRELPGAPEAEA
jgi:hypothetical protein